MSSDGILDTEQVARQINYWFDLAEYDRATGRALLVSRRLLYVMFMCHQAIEKALKGVYVARHRVMAPRIHGLVALAQRAEIYQDLTPDQQEFLEALDPMNIACRYPDETDKLLAALTRTECETALSATEDMLKWIKQKLSDA